MYNYVAISINFAFRWFDSSNSWQTKVIIDFQIDDFVISLSKWFVGSEYVSQLSVTIAITSHNL